MALYPDKCDQSGTYTFGFLVLLFLALFRPFTISFHHLGSVSLLDLFGIASSYLMLIGLAFYLRNLPFNRMSLLLLFFVGYCLLSLAWGSCWRDVARTILPLLPFFLVQSVIRTPRQMNVLIICLALGYIIPIFGSSLLITLGISSYEITQSGFERQEGLTAGVHTLAHTMMVFSYVYALFLVKVKSASRPLRWLLFGMLVLSVYCIWKTYTRTVFLGGLVFWLMFLWKKNKRWFWGLLVTALVGGLLYSANLQDLFWQKNIVGHRIHDLDTASSGRFFLWSHNIAVYSRLSIPLKLLGVGIGNEMKVVSEIGVRTASSHNDYLTMLMTTGLIGLLLILTIYISLLILVIKSSADRQLKYLFLGIIIAVMLMNMVSNSYLIRFPLSQYFWLLIGMFFVMVRQQQPVKHG